jgi:hypothetical protein
MCEVHHAKVINAAHARLQVKHEHDERKMIKIVNASILL